MANKQNISYVALVLLLLGNMTPTFAKKSAELRVPVVENIPPRNEFYVTRDKLTKQIEMALEKKGSSALVTLVGMAGMGKTQLAKEYAHAYAGNYNIVWWINANQDILPQIRELGLKLGDLKECDIPDRNETNQTRWGEYIKACCDQYSLKILFIIDDVKDYKQIKFIEPYLQSNVDAIFTSRNQSMGKIKMSLKCFTRAESLNYLNKALPNSSLGSLNKLAEVLNDYPLALAQAVSCIKHLPSLSIEDYLKIYQTKRNSLWQEEEQFTKNKQDQQGTVFSTFMLLLDQMRKASPQAFQLLKFSSFLGSQHIPKSLLKSWMLNSRKGNELEFHKALSTLIKYSVFEKTDENRTNKDEYFNIHSLLHEFIRGYINNEENEIYLAEAIAMFSLILPESSYQMRNILFEDANLEFHLSTLLNFADHYEVHSIPLLNLEIKYLYYTKFTKPNYEDDLKKLDKLKSKLRTNKIPNLEKARFLIISSNIATRKNGMDEAIQISEEAENLLTSMDTPEAKEELFFLLVNHLMDFYNLQGNLTKAELAAEKAKLLLPQIHNMNYVTLYYFMRSLQLLNKGDYEEALKHVNASLEEQRSDDFPAYFRFFKNITKSEILPKLGDLENALNIAKDNYQKLQKIYKKDINYKILKSESILAFIYLKKEKLEKSANFIKNLFSKLNILFHNQNESPIQGFAHLILGELYEKQGNLLKALEEYKKAEDVYSHIFKTIEVDDISYLYKNMIVLGRKMGNAFLSKKYLTLLMEHFGIDHPRTIESLRYLDAHKLSVL